MYVSDLNFRHWIEPDMLRRAMSTALAGQTDVTMQVEQHGGDFPLLVRLVLPMATNAPTLDQVFGIARALNAIIVTDDVEVGPLYDDGFSLISPDGTLAVVHADDAELDNDDLVLTPESREALRRAEARFAASAAD